MKMTYLSHDHYRVSDADAGRLARASAHGRLPRPGHSIDVTLPDGARAELLRTPYTRAGHTDAPKRGWVWAVMPHGRGRTW